MDGGNYIVWEENIARIEIYQLNMLGYWEAMSKMFILSLRDYVLDPGQWVFYIVDSVAGDETEMGFKVVDLIMMDISLF